MKSCSLQITVLFLSTQLQLCLADNISHLRGSKILNIDTREDMNVSRLLHSSKKSKKGKKAKRETKQSSDFMASPKISTTNGGSGDNADEKQDEDAGSFMGSPGFQPTAEQLQNATQIPANPDAFEEKYKPCVKGLYHVLIADDQDIVLDYFLNLHNGHCIVIKERCPSFYREDLITYSSCADECLLPNAENPC